MNPELRALFEQDQADRRAGPPDAETQERDRARQRRLETLLTAGDVRTAEDHYHAAMLLQHGETPDDARGAHELAGRATALGHRPGRWLAAAAHDRWLVRQGRPQKYGTQAHRPSADQPWELWPADPATTDAERAAWDVKPLAQLRPGESSWRRPDSAEGAEPPP